jgi:hypothetical protein
MGSHNQISYRAYCQLGGCLNSDLAKRHFQHGDQHFTTYHHIGEGQAYWKQDKAKGPALTSDQ